MSTIFQTAADAKTPITMQLKRNNCPNDVGKADRRDVACLLLPHPMHHGREAIYEP